MIGNHEYSKFIIILIEHVTIHPCDCTDKCRTAICHICHECIKQVSYDHLCVIGYKSICNSINCFVKYCHEIKINWKTTFDFDKIPQDKPFPYKHWRYKIDPPDEFVLRQTIINKHIASVKTRIIYARVTKYKIKYSMNLGLVTITIPKVSDVETKYYPFCNELVIDNASTDHMDLINVITKMICGHRLRLRRHSLNILHGNNYLVWQSWYRRINHQTHISIKRYDNRFIIYINHNMNADEEDREYTCIEFDLE